MKVINIVLAISLLQTFKLQAQDFTQTIRGTIIDKTTNIPIPGANVIILNTDPLIGTTSDVDGNFRFEKIKIGRLNMKVSFIGYNDVYLSNQVLSSGKNLVLTIEMEEKVESMNEVVITANADKSEPINKLAIISSRGFTIEETERYAGARGDVGRMASNFAGVTGANDARNDIVIRGNTPSGLLWRLEGVDIPNPNHFAAFGTTGGPICMLKNSMLSNSDFLTSAFPAEYGNAIAGVFDLKMRNGNNERHEFMAQFGFNGLELGAEGPISKKNGSSYLIDYSYSSLAFFNKFDIQFGAGDAIPKYQDMSFKVNLPKTKIGHISIFGLAGISDIALQDSKKDTTKQKIDFYGSEGWDVINYSAVGVVGLTNTYIINSTTYARFTLAGIYHNFRFDKDSVIPFSLSTFLYERSSYTENNLFTTLFINKKLNTHHNFKAGIQITRPTYDLIDSVYYGGINHFKTSTNYNGSTYLFQPYIQWQYKITNNLVLNPGLHFQYLLNNGSWSLEPRIGLKWYIAPSHSLSVGYGRHSQTVPITVFYKQAQLPDGSYQKTNDHLGFLLSNHYVLGYDWNINDYMRLKAEVYYQEIANVPVDKSGPSSFSVLNLGANFDIWSPDTLASKGTGDNYGLELTIERFIHKGLYFLLTSSLYDSKYKGSDGVQRNTAFNGNYAFNLVAGKEIVFKGKKSSKHQKSLIFNLKSTYSGGQRYTPINQEESISQQTKIYYDNLAFSKQFPPYNRTDLKISFKRNGKKVTIEWALEIVNLFNQKNVYTQYFNKKTGEIYYTYQLGRTIMPLYKITF